MKALYSTFVMTALMVSLTACGSKKSSGGDGDTSQNPPAKSETQPTAESDKKAEKKPEQKSEQSAPVSTGTSNSPSTAANTTPVVPAQDPNVKVTGACKMPTGCNYYVFSGGSKDVATLVDSYKDACVSGSWANSCSAPNGACSVGVTGKIGSATVKTAMVLGTSVAAAKQMCDMAGLPYVSSL